MVENKHKGKCYHCDKEVKSGDGYLEKRENAKTDKWRVIHKDCWGDYKDGK